MSTPDSNDNNLALLEQEAEFVKSLKLLYTICMPMMQLNLLGTLYVLLRTFLRWKSSNSLSLAHRVPFYIAIIDLLIYLSLVPTYMTVLLYGRLPSTCAVSGAFLIATSASNMILVCIVAISAYLRVCHQFVIDFGRWDWKLHTTVACLAVTGALMAIPTLGQAGFFCAASGLYFEIINFVAIYAILGICIFCYVMIARKLRETKRTIKKAFRSGNVTREQKIELRVMLKTSSYVFMFILNWAPSTLFQIGTFLDWFPYWVFVIALLTYSSGGVLNALQYAINETPWGVDDGSRATGQGTDMEKGSVVTVDTNGEERMMWKGPVEVVDLEPDMN